MSPYRLCSSSCLMRTPSGTGSLPWEQEEDTAISTEGINPQGWVLWGSPQGHSLGHLGDVLVAQGDPEVIILIQENLLHPRLPDATCLISGKGNKARWVRGAWRDMGTCEAWGDTGQGNVEGS